MCIVYVWYLQNSSLTGRHVHKYQTHEINLSLVAQSNFTLTCKQQYVHIVVDTFTLVIRLS